MRAEQRPVPLQVTRAKGALLWDADGHEYVDYVLGFGAALLGHAPDAVRRGGRRAAAARRLAPGAPHAGRDRARRARDRAAFRAPSMVRR